MIARSLLTSLAVLAAFAPLQASVVKVDHDAQGKAILLRDGQPFFINGAGGSGSMELLKKSGGNTIRTWGAEQLPEQVNGKSLLDRAQENGLAVIAGIWIQHERHGFDYSDEAKLKKQRDHVRDTVTKFKDHPAILVWGLGNEMEGPIGGGKDVRIWKELNVLAGIIKEIDPNHPVMTVIAGSSADKIKGIMADYPNIDILGVNAYSSAPGVGAGVTAAGWKKPFVLTEFGPNGQWEVPKTTWGAPIEASSSKKAASYIATYKLVTDDSKNICLGTVAFLWSWKQEATSTWYGMLLKTGEKLPQVDAMTFAWTGAWPANRSPRIASLDSEIAEKEVAPDKTVTATLNATDAENDPLTYEWSVVSEATDLQVGGDKESTPPAHPECIVSTEGNKVTLKTPTKPGAYRLFVIVRDGKGSAGTANTPFLVK